MVSLVPSLTEALIDFGLLESLVGRTRYCTEPHGVVEAIQEVGGTKNPDVAGIVRLRPEMVVVNREENRLEDCLALEAAGLRLHVTHPRTVPEAADMLAELGRVCGAAEAGEVLGQHCHAAVAEAALRLRGRSLATFCPIWRRPYMTFRRATYIGDMLARAGCHNVFGDRSGPDFFQITLDELREAAPELVVLPDEPYAFDSFHADELLEAGLRARFVLVDGKDLAWYGPRIPRALHTLGAAVQGAPDANILPMS
ncbi:MAG: ABC transporter substrate-binding protein [Deltaproteobacteria bacterium]|nr:ABC transporter substrate-binding protein [Deltaproteobacteria bacterium]